jgi:hypothetical protein
VKKVLEKHEGYLMLEERIILKNLRIMLASTAMRWSAYMQGMK